MDLDIVCFGALNLDRLYKVDRIAKGGEERIILGLEEHPGGSAANTAVGLARLELKVGYIGMVADDREGRISLNALQREGIDTGGIRISRGGRSGVVNGYLDESGERALYVDPGVNDSIELDEAVISYASSTRYVHLTSFVGEKPFKAQRKLLETLPRHVKVTLDPGHIYAVKGMKDLYSILHRCFAVMPNAHELRLITGKGVREGSKKLLDVGASVVAVKLGQKGCYVTDGNEEHTLDAYRVEVVDTTGAGDAFCAGFLYGLIKGKSLRESGLLGNFVASRCITEVGARQGLPHHQEVETLRFLNYT